MTETVYDVVALGNAIVDVIAPVEPDFIQAWSIEPNAMSLIEEDRAKQLTQAAKGAEHSGGSAANTVAGIASFGGNTGYIGKVSEDRLGAFFRKDMAAQGICFETEPLADGPATARSIIFVTPDGARSMNTYLGASVLFSASDVDESMVRQAGILYLEGYLFDREAAKTAFVHASELAAAAGRKVALTLSDQFCVERHRASFLHLIRNHVDILFANEVELLALYETDDFEAAIAQLQKDSPLAAITRSEKGSAVIQAGQDPLYVEAEPVAQVIDTTGAGDQYAAGFLYGLARAKPLGICARLGHIAAAEVISHYGPRPETSYKDLADQGGIAL